jgi:hypothetical protein
MSREKSSKRRCEGVEHKWEQKWEVDVIAIFKKDLSKNLLLFALQ